MTVNACIYASGPMRNYDTISFYLSMSYAIIGLFHIFRFFGFCIVESGLVICVGENMYRI